MSYIGSKNSVALYDSYTKEQSEAKFGSPYASKDIGEPFAIFDHLSGIEPPDNSGDKKFIKLTAGEDGAGQYNAGLLTNETVSASGPLIEITAEIASGPSTGEVINLVNSENRYLMPGEASGTVANDHMQGHHHNFSSREGSANGSIADTNIKSATGAGNTLYKATDAIADGTNGTPRTSDHTNVKHMQVTYYMRIA